NGDGLRHQNGVIADHGAGLYGVFSDAQLGLVRFFKHCIQGDGAYVAVGQGDHEGGESEGGNIRGLSLEDSKMHSKMHSINIK
ncbi:hypothetical protein LOD44_11030, partial [Xylella fastidiosa subsp. multiplex]|nr:hypothetical protein [Xylella fastidiosa subsp. multiplex]MDD0905858.1 hypothetical protein [Xylella fastidiosa subsp. multiplex]MDD0916974.1 hypothetical protein [Xylella fastidiosa subsp. multiplex]MDD0919296.1 hypothetical protein [Xylella fastidiosa subsp. multiplex]MDD0950599.1 hypothetical protein [Xylella fastidiosa subsp. multiplex]